MSFNLRVYGILINEQNQLLVSDEYIRGMKITKFPGGGLEFGEGTRDCLKREFLEETGYQCENLRFLLSIKDKFISTDIKNLHIYYDQYDFKKNYTCYEGVSLDFYTIEKAKDLKMPTYLIHIWELAILALQSNQPKIY